MKGYIRKEYLLEHILYGILTGHYQEPEDVFAVVDTFPTIAQVDICREFADILKAQLNPQTGNYDMGFNYEKMCERIDDLLAEMENGE